MNPNNVGLQNLILKQFKAYIEVTFSFKI